MRLDVGLGVVVIGGTLALAVALVAAALALIVAVVALNAAALRGGRALLAVLSTIGGNDAVLLVAGEAAKVELRNILLAQVELTLEVAERVGANVAVHALQVGDRLLRHLAGVLEVRVGREEDAAELEIEVGANVGELHAVSGGGRGDGGDGLRDGVVAEADNSVALVGLHLRADAVVGGADDGVGAVVGAEGDEDGAVDALEGDLGVGGALEEIEEEVLKADEEGLGVELRPLEDEEGLGADGCDVLAGDGLEVEGVHREDAELDHVEDLEVELAAEDEVVGALLGVGAEAEEGAIILEAQELEVGGAVPRVEGVALGELLSEGLHNVVEVVHGVGDNLGGGLALEEEGLLGILEDLRVVLLQSALRLLRLALTALETSHNGGHGYRKIVLCVCWFSLFFLFLF